MLPQSAEAGPQLPPSALFRPRARSPMMVSAQVNPDSAASRLPSSGSGAVADTGSIPTKKHPRPRASTAMYTTSRPRIRSPRSQGLSSTTQSGAVACRKMALAAVVSLFDWTKRIMVTA